MNCSRLLSLLLACFGSTSLLAEIVINEIHYDPPVKTERLEFIELHNTGSAAVDLSGWQLAGAVEFTFPAGTQIEAGGYVVAAELPVAVQLKYGIAAVGPWTGLLANDGERITLRDSSGRVMDEVTYRLGFPWPTVGDMPGYSIELINPALDNDLGGSWRPSVRGNPAAQTEVLIPERSSWRYKKGTEEASVPINAWRELTYNDGGWSAGNAPVGYDSRLPMGTTLADMRGRYTSVYLRKTFQVADPAEVGSLKLEALYDDGIQVWINGRKVVNASLPDRDVAYHELATGAARESSAYDEFLISAPGAFLRAGENIIAVQLHNVLLSESSDCFVDIKLTAQLGGALAGPTPGARNSIYDTNLPPQIRQVNHSPEQPRGGDSVKITAKITDADGIAGVQLLYQVVNPGSYIELNDSAYETTWMPLAMTDDGSGGDDLAGDDIYTAVLPSSLQVHRRLVRYRILATDGGSRSIRAPYLEDPQPNFAYFVYNGVPGWQASARPGSAPAQAFTAEEMGRLPTYHLIARREAVEEATWHSRYGGDEYLWWGTLVYDGQVYDHIRYRARGGVWRYAMGKNMWKFDFNRGHDFQARDNYGEEYQTRWRKLNLGANIQQGDYLHRGEQGMFESVGFRLFNLAGVDSPRTHWINYRIIDDAQEAPANDQYGGDFWGLYLAIEQEDGRFLDEHGLPDGNLYKMESGTGELNNQGRTAPTDKSDLNLFLNTFHNLSNPPSEAWWRANLDLEKFYSYHAIVQGIHHYDICYGKNYFYYHNPDTGRWSVHSWDLDLTWADNMYDAGCDGRDDIRDRLVTRTPFDIEYRNRIREIRDLLFNSDQALKVIEEHARIVRGTNAGPNILAADRAMWDYHPVMGNGSIVNLSKSGQGRFYQFPLESAVNPARRGSFEAAVEIMKDYVVKRAAVLDSRSNDPAIPPTPSISYAGSTNYPANRIALRSSSYAGGAAFAAMEWRVGEIREAAPGQPGKYEIEAAWESPALTAFTESVAVPADTLKVGRTYRARVRMQDVTGRWSHWSAPLEFTTGEPDNAAALQQYLQVTEIMYNPPAGADFEFIELHNSSSNVVLELGGAAFVDGIDFIFPAGATLAPGAYTLVVQANPAEDFAAFRQHYSLDGAASIFGPYSGSLNNDGERLTLKTAAAGAEIFSFTFSDREGWPIAPDGTGHSLVHGAGSLDYPGTWRASSFMRGSPGQADPLLAPGVVLNELAAHTDYQDPERPEYDSNDWIELFNSGAETMLDNFYLSDNAANLKLWQLPRVPLASRGQISFDEVTHFHNPLTTGFGLNKAGEELYLSYLPGTAADRVVDAIRFKGQESGRTFGRFPDGGTYLFSLLPTRDAANRQAALDLRISEIMYHPPDDTNAAASLEFIEVYNAGLEMVNLAGTNGAFRLDGGISFQFPEHALAPGATVVVVNFDPSLATEADRFKATYGIANSGVTLLGPFTGRLANSSDRVALEKPEAPDQPGEPAAWVVVDESIYTDASGADGDALSLHRLSLDGSGNDPANLAPGPPSPGIYDTPLPDDSDEDGLPDDWELSFGLDPMDAADALADRDGDGLNNLAEFQVGTDPTNPESLLALQLSRSGEVVSIAFEGKTGKTYTVQYRDDLSAGAWQKLANISGEGGIVSLSDQLTSNFRRYYRIISPSIP